MKPLLQDDFKFKIVKDLGMVFATSSSTEKKRYGVFQCPICQSNTRMSIQSVKRASKCSKCRNRNNKIISITHGDTGSRLNNVYKNMLQRVLNTNLPQAKDYIERGITICNSWLDSYETFREWALSNGYSDELMLDRENNDKGYSPTNCRWVTRTIQNRNKRILMATNNTGFRGVTKTTQNKSFTASISVDSCKIYIGCFPTKEEAAKAYDKYVIDNKLEHTINAY